MKFPSLMALLLGACVLMTAPSAARAHGDHDEPVPAVGLPGVARADAHSDDFELVAMVAEGHFLTIYLDRFQTNEPVAKAAIEVSRNGDDGVMAEAQADGTYRLAADWADQPGRHDLTFTVTAGDLSDLLTATLEIAPRVQEIGSGAPPKGRLQQAIAGQRSILTPILAFLLGVSAAVAFLVRGRRRVALGGIVVVTILLLSGFAFADTIAPAAQPTAPEAARR